MKYIPSCSLKYVVGTKYPNMYKVKPTHPARRNKIVIPHTAQKFMPHKRKRKKIRYKHRAQVGSYVAAFARVVPHKLRQAMANSMTSGLPNFSFSLLIAQVNAQSRQKYPLGCREEPKRRPDRQTSFDPMSRKEIEERNQSSRYAAQPPCTVLGGKQFPFHIYPILSHA